MTGRGAEILGYKQLIKNKSGHLELPESTAQASDYRLKQCLRHWIAVSFQSAQAFLLALKTFTSKQDLNMKRLSLLQRRNQTIFCDVLRY